MLSVPCVIMRDDLARTDPRRCLPSKDLLDVLDFCRIRIQNSSHPPLHQGSKSSNTSSVRSGLSQSSPGSHLRPSPCHDVFVCSFSSSLSGARRTPPRILLFPPGRPCRMLSQSSPTPRARLLASQRCSLRALHWRQLRLSSLYQPRSSRTFPLAELFPVSPPRKNPSRVPIRVPRACLRRRAERLE
ncbi:hypothetical protein M427DRAFT_211755 [Gonapodya prolifera JEL478]|uniref:Uncharacterized protein n=1 Tax=Gonapodya prolifera (strain JEL478) TaxID=1344416 RepID=A0A139APR1_GONPJ|nr:hypothetical protein M427DRAFT_211755 [Gonapodya prolifera JEL478]|eukprot:KXS18493.1 hypothetical protein M427DRAFT_211755 [Gonapodya prolifera JEL478]